MEKTKQKMRTWPCIIKVEESKEQQQQSGNIYEISSNYVNSLDLTWANMELGQTWVFKATWISSCNFWGMVHPIGTTRVTGINTMSKILQ